MRLQFAFLLPLAASLALGCSSAASPAEENDNSALSATDMNQRQHKLEHVVVGQSALTPTRERLGIVKWDVFAGQDPGTSFNGTVLYASDENNDARYVFAVSGSDFLFMVLNKEGDNVTGTTSVDEKDYELLKQDVASLRVMLGKMSTTKPVDSGSCALAIAVASVELIGLSAFAAITPVAALIGAYAGGFIALGNIVGVVIGASAASLTVLGTVYKGVIAIKDDVAAVPKACSSDKR